MRRLLLLAALIAAVPTPARAARYTLAALLERLGREHPAVLAARATQAMREAQRLEQQLRWLPDGEARFYATGAPEVRCLDPDAPGSSLVDSSPEATQRRLNYCLRTNVVDVVRSASGTTFGDRAPTDGPLLTFNVQLRQPLYTSGKISAAVGAAKGGVGTEVANVETARLDAGVAAVRAFAQLKAARAIVATIESGLATHRDWLSRVERELDGLNPSRYTESDVLRMKAQLTAVELWLLDHRRNAAGALGALRALADDPEADVDESELSFADPPVPAPKVWRDRMLDHRPELRWAQAGLSYYAAWRRLQGAWALPDLALVSGLGWGYSPTFDQPSLAFANQPASALGGGFFLAVRQSLDLGPKLARWHQARREERMQRLRFGLGLAYWGFEVDKAWLDLDEAKRRLAETRRGEAVSQGWLVTVDTNLAIGADTDGRELVEVMNSWVQFRMRRITALADTLVALATLERLTGQPISAVDHDPEAPRRGPGGGRP